MIAFAKIADKKVYEAATKRLSAIVVAERSKCIYAGLILQRSCTSSIEGVIRNNLGCRICMGQMSDTAYKMAFGSDFTGQNIGRKTVSDQALAGRAALQYRQDRVGCPAPSFPDGS